MKRFGRHHHDDGLVRHEEGLLVDTRTIDIGSIGVTKTVTSEPYDAVLPRDVEHVEAEHATVDDGDSGEVETLADGSISIPVFEERIVVTRELVVRERIIVRKRTVSEQYRIETDLRSERVQVDEQLTDAGATRIPSTGLIDGAHPAAHAE